MNSARLHNESVEADDNPLRIDRSSPEQSPKRPRENVSSALIEVGSVWPAIIGESGNGSRVRGLF